MEKQEVKNTDTGLCRYCGMDSKIGRAELEIQKSRIEWAASELRKARVARDECELRIKHAESELRKVHVRREQADSHGVAQDPPAATAAGDGVRAFKHVEDELRKVKSLTANARIRLGEAIARLKKARLQTKNVNGNVG